tara:strand:+ start:177 stop:380 length:204 start_codon:yes stop_codon:yes gene_type:complete
MPPPDYRRDLQYDVKKSIEPKKPKPDQIFEMPSTKNKTANKKKAKKKTNKKKTKASKSKSNYRKSSY